VHRHQRETQSAIGPTSADELTRSPAVVGGEDDPEGRYDDVEFRVRVWQRLRIADIEADVEPVFRRTGTSTFDPVLRNVDSCDPRAGPRSEQGRTAGSRPYVQNRLAGPRVNELEDGRLRADVSALEPFPRPGNTFTCSGARPRSSVHWRRLCLFAALDLPARNSWLFFVDRESSLG